MFPIKKMGFAGKRLGDISPEWRVQISPLALIQERAAEQIKEKEFLREKLNILGAVNQKI